MHRTQIGVSLLAAVAVACSDGERANGGPLGTADSRDAGPGGAAAPVRDAARTNLDARASTDAGARDAASSRPDAAPLGDGPSSTPADGATSAEPSGQCTDGRWVPTAPQAPRVFEAPYEGLEDSCGPALARRLCEIASTGYRAISYTQARQVVFRMVDDEGGTVRGVYDGLLHEPDHSELNIEHTWPQSLGATGDAKSDMHHLFATRADFNSARSNLPLGKVARHDWPATLVADPSCTPTGHDQGCFSMKGRDAEDVEVFEPRDAHKGNAARAIFYFAIRWGQGCSLKPLRDFDTRHPSTTELVLKEWNRLDPPDPHERDRNARVQEVEQVRNPFIDHPELVERISFQ